jgi:hypothetical protein
MAGLSAKRRGAMQLCCAPYFYSWEVIFMAFQKGRAKYKWPDDYEELKNDIDDYVRNTSIIVKNLRGLRRYLKDVTKETFSEWQTNLKKYGNQTYGTDNDTSYRHLLEDAYDDICNDLLQSGAAANGKTTMQAMELNKSFGYNRQDDNQTQVKIQIELPEEMKQYAK